MKSKCQFPYPPPQNKKQRQTVREAVLRMKDPAQMLAEIEEIEKQETEALTDPLPNEKGLQEKKRKLHSSIDRVLKYWVSGEREGRGGVVWQGYLSFSSS